MKSMKLNTRLDQQEGEGEGKWMNEWMMGVK